MTRPIFAAYRGDEFVDVGTARELAKSLGKSRKYVYNRAAPSSHRNPKRSGTISIYRIGEEAE